MGTEQDLEQVLARAAAADAYRLALSDALRDERDPAAIDGLGARMLADHLQVNRSTYCRIDGEDLVVLYADSTRLVQALSNLIHNATKLTPDRLPRLFELFARGERSPGLGIGLALARYIVELHGGTIEIESAGAGHGSRFAIRPRRAPRSRCPRRSERS